MPSAGQERETVGNPGAIRAEPLNPGGYAELDATAAAEAVRAHAVSPVELVEAALGRIEQLEPSLNACTVVFAEEALAEARAAERRIAQGLGGVLGGVPVAIKDVIWVRGAPATMGTRVLADFVPDEDAAVVGRLREAGAIVVAKTTNPPFCGAGYTASELHSVTRNPWRLDCTPGGSSGGSAAVVAAGMTPLALGTDAGGSIRVPAAFCGIAGLKPTHGLVPRGPCFEEMRTLNAVGPMARSVRDLALCLNVLAGADPADNLSVATADVDYLDAVATACADDLCVAWSADLGGGDVDDAVRDAFGRAIDALGRSGWKLEEACPTLPQSSLIQLTVGDGERGTFADGREELIEPRIRPWLERADKLSAREYYAAQLSRAEYTRAWEEFFTRYDLILTPTVPFAAFGADPQEKALINGREVDVDQDVWWELSLPANLTGGPAASVPMGLSAEGLPLGLQVMGPRFHDARCIAAAASIEAILPWPRVAPLNT